MALQFRRLTPHHEHHFLNALMLLVSHTIFYVLFSACGAGTDLNAVDKVPFRFGMPFLTSHPIRFPLTLDTISLRNKIVCSKDRNRREKNCKYMIFGYEKVMNSLEEPYRGHLQQSKQINNHILYSQ